MRDYGAQGRPDNLKEEKKAPRGELHECRPAAVEIQWWASFPWWKMGVRPNREPEAFPPCFLEQNLEEFENPKFKLIWVVTAYLSTQEDRKHRTNILTCNWEITGYAGSVCILPWACACWADLGARRESKPGLGRESWCKLAIVDALVREALFLGRDTEEGKQGATE